MAMRLEALALAALIAGSAGAAEQRRWVSPHDTDPRLAEGEPPHLVVYDDASPAAPLVVWLAGTGGQPATGPRGLYDTALQRGYRLLALSYLNTPAVSQVCVAARLRTDTDCAQRFRQQRAWGLPSAGLVNDRPEDAIVPRLTRALQHLARTDAAGGWDAYLDGDTPRWERLVLAGQSQGGGMAAFIAQAQAVAGVLVFSGGWDRSATGMAAWYGRPSATPLNRWHATYHVAEPQAAAMAQIYTRLGLPSDQIHALDEPVRGGNPHGEGIGNPAYRPLWERMLPAR